MNLNKIFNLQIIIILIINIVLNFSCSTSSKEDKISINDESKFVSIDTTKAVKIDNLWAIPKKNFEFNSQLPRSKDTLSLVICSDYVYSPFGNIRNKAELNGSLLKNFSIINRVDTLDYDTFEFQILNHKSSRLILFFYEGQVTHSYVYKGEIHDNSVYFSNNIRIGMTIGNFYQSFFDLFPNELATKYQVIELYTCVDDIKHIYKFEKGKLISVEFVNGGNWTIDY